METEINKIHALLEEANTARSQQRLDDAKRNIVSALAISRLIQDMKLRVQTLSDLARIDRDLGNTIASIAGYMKLAKLCQKNSDKPGMAHAFRQLADIYCEQNHFDKAGEYYRKAISMYKQEAENESLNLANTFRGYALLLAKQQKNKEALIFLEDARKLYNIHHLNEGVDECSRWIEKLTT